MHNAIIVELMNLLPSSYAVKRSKHYDDVLFVWLNKPIIPRSRACKIECDDLKGIVFLYRLTIIQKIARPINVVSFDYGDPSWVADIVEIIVKYFEMGIWLKMRIKY